MIHFKKHFIYSPGGENENSKDSSFKKEEENKSNEQIPKGEKEEPKPLLKKIKDALQDWSNDDQSDLEFDDTRV